MRNAVIAGRRRKVPAGSLRRRGVVRMEHDLVCAIHPRSHRTSDNATRPVGLRYRPTGRASVRNDLGR